MSSQLPEKTNARNIVEKIIISGSQIGSVSPPASPGYSNVHDIAKEKVLQKGATSVGLVFTDENPSSQGTAVHSIVESYKIEAGATEVGSVGSVSTASVGLELYENSIRNPQKSQAPRTNVPSSTIPSSNPSSRSVPAKKYPNSFGTLKDNQDTTDDKIKGPNASARHQVVTHHRNEGRTISVSNQPAPGQVTIFKQIRTSVSTDDSEDISHICISDGSNKRGQGSLVHNCLHNVNSRGTHISSVGGKEHAKLARDIAINQKCQKKDGISSSGFNNFKHSGNSFQIKESASQGTFTFPKGEDKTISTVVTGDAKFEQKVVVTQQGSTGKTLGDVFLKNTEVGQYKVVVQPVPGARGDITGSENHGLFNAKDMSLIVTPDLSNADPNRDPKSNPFEDQFFTEK